jgi:hypothetical protein
LAYSKVRQQEFWFTAEPKQFDRFTARIDVGHLYISVVAGYLQQQANYFFGDSQTE